MFSPDERVICVDASLPANPWHRAHPLVRGRVYVVHALGPYHPTEPCIDIDGSGRMWECRRFRPLRKTTTDISIFTAMLTGTKVSGLKAVPCPNN
jgi:hypothetical protein